MATILAYTSPALGNLYPLCALLIALRRRGHRIALRTLDRGVDCGNGLGFETAPIDKRIQSIEMTDWKAANGREALRVAFEVFGARAPFEVDDLSAAIDAEAPDALIVDPNTWGAAAVAEAVGLPWATFYPYTPLLRSPGTPPFGPGIRPWRGPAGRLRDSLLRPLVMNPVNGAMVGPVNDVRTALGLDKIRSAEEFVRRPPLILVASAEPFQYPGFALGHESLHLIGPCEFDPPMDGHAWLDDIDARIVLVTTSSDPQADQDLVRVAIEAFADEPVHLVATLPSGVPHGLASRANATVVDFIPHGRVLDRAVCAITHGGMGVTQKALARGVPVCVVPHGRDQFEVARRVEVSGCGTRLPVRKLTPSRLRVNTLRAMSMVAGAQRMAESFAATGGVARGAELVESHLLTQ
jgi:MGT family glycosyltransferase